MHPSWPKMWPGDYLNADKNINKEELDTVELDDCWNGQRHWLRCCQFEFVIVVVRSCNLNVICLVRILQNREDVTWNKSSWTQSVQDVGSHETVWVKSVGTSGQRTKLGQPHDPCKGNSKTVTSALEIAAYKFLQIVKSYYHITSLQVLQQTPASGWAFAKPSLMLPLWCPPSPFRHSTVSQHPGSMPQLPSPR